MESRGFCSEQFGAGFPQELGRPRLSMRKKLIARPPTPLTCLSAAGDSFLGAEGFDVPLVSELARLKCVATVIEFRLPPVRATLKCAQYVRGRVAALRGPRATRSRRCTGAFSGSWQNARPRRETAT